MGSRQDDFSGQIKIRNQHERMITAPPERIAALIEPLHDRVLEALLDNGEAAVASGELPRPRQP